MSIPEAVFQNAPMGFVVRDREGRIQDVNPWFCRMLGYSRDEMLQMEFLDFPPPEDARRSWESYREIVQGIRDTAQFERRYETRDGRIVYAKVTISVVRDSQGNFQHGLSMVEDVTKMRETQDTQKGLQLLYGCDVLGFLEGTVEGPLARVNGIAASLLQIPSGTQIQWEDIPSAADAWTWRRKTSELRIAHTVAPFEITLKGGTPVLMGLWLTCANTFQAFLLDRRVAQEAENLKLKNQSLEWFTRAASHDLHEPLRKIRMFGEILQERLPEMDEESGQYLSYMTDGATRLQNLLDDLLAYSRTGGPTDLRWVPLHSIVQEALANLTVESAEITVDPCLPEVQVDRSQMVLVLQNLLSNALKYRKGETVRIAVRAVPGGLEIQDNGLGFNPSYRERIFEPFCRLVGKQFRGTGLGLAISQRIMQAHGGILVADSTPGVGSTFRLTLPPGSVHEPTHVDKAA